MKSKIILTTLLTILLVPSLVFAAFTVNSKEFHHVVDQLDMQGHADHELSTCSVKKVYYEEVVDMLNDGKSEDDIIQTYVEEYGQAALRTPGTDLGGILAWTMPVIGLGIGIVIVTIWIKRITNNKQTQPQQEIIWESETEREIFEKTMDEERRKFF